MKMHIRTAAIAFFAGLMMCGAAACQHGDKAVQAAGEPETAATHPGNNPSVDIKGADLDFVLQAEKSNLQERVIGRMAEERSKNSDIKDYGEMLVKDHNQALKKLVALMDKNGVTEPKGLPDERKEAIDKFKGMSGQQFDREFINMMVQDHEKAIELFNREAQDGQNSDVRSYANDVLPVLQKHLDRARELQKNG